MPPDIASIRDSLPQGSRLVMGANNRQGFYGLVDRFRRFGDKALIGTGIAAGLYAAYKLGQHKDAVMNKFNKVRTSLVNYGRNLTKSWR